jgi:hypothetical protein
MAEFNELLDEDIFKFAFRDQRVWDRINKK